MAYGNKPLQATAITAPGFFGLNTQDSGVSMETAFATQAYNAVIDRYGRIGARKGWTYKTTSGGTAANIESMFEFNNGDGTFTLISAGNNKIYTGEATLTQKAVRNSTDTADLTYTITANNWQIVQAEYETGLNKSAHAYLIQASHPTLIYHKLGSTAHAHTGSFGLQRLGDMGTVPTGYTTTTFMPNCGLAAYGRLWLANSGNDDLTVYYSALLDASDFSGVGSGFINLEQVVPGGESIVALAEHNNYLVIFLKNTIVLYANADNIDNLQLADVITGVGCVARDSVQNIGTDIIFLSDSGVRGLARTIQEKSAPIRDISRNVRDQLMDYVKLEDLAKVRSVYFEQDAFYLLILPTSTFTFCFDLRQFLQDGSARATFWDTISPRAAVVTNNNRLLLGKLNGVAEYDGYTDNSAAYIFSYYSPFVDFGSPSITKVLKKIGITVVGSSATTIDLRWAFDYQTNYKTAQVTTATASVSEFGIAEYAIGTYSASVVIDQIKKQLSGSGNVIQIGIDAAINGTPLSIQKIDIYAIPGRTI
jgi:hypothetical protein